MGADDDQIDMLASRQVEDLGGRLSLANLGLRGKALLREDVPGFGYLLFGLYSEGLGDRRVVGIKGIEAIGAARGVRVNGQEQESGARGRQDAAQLPEGETRVIRAVRRRQNLHEGLLESGERLERRGWREPNSCLSWAAYDR